MYFDIFQRFVALNLDSFQHEISSCFIFLLYVCYRYGITQTT